MDMYIYTDTSIYQSGAERIHARVIGQQRQVSRAIRDSSIVFSNGCFARFLNLRNVAGRRLELFHFLYMSCGFSFLFGAGVSSLHKLSFFEVPVFSIRWARGFGGSVLSWVFKHFLSVTSYRRVFSSVLDFPEFPGCSICVASESCWCKIKDFQSDPIMFVLHDNNQVLRSIFQSSFLRSKLFGRWPMAHIPADIFPIVIGADQADETPDPHQKASEATTANSNIYIFPCQFWHKVVFSSALTQFENDHVANAGAHLRSLGSCWLIWKESFYFGGRWFAGPLLTIT